jgi:cytochrome subunit of sulfide dehydrogenase
MKYYRSNRGFIFLTLFFAALIVSCQKDLIQQDEQPVSSANGDAVLASEAPSSQARTLSANCFQCHGTNGHAGELKIASMSAASIINKFNAYKQKAANADIMYLHAQSYSTDEIALIADFFSQQ